MNFSSATRAPNCRAREVAGSNSDQTIYQERLTAVYSCHDVFTNRFIFRLDFPPIQTPTEAMLPNHKH